MTSGCCRLTITEDALLVETRVNKFDLLTSMLVQSGDLLLMVQSFKKETSEKRGKKYRERTKEWNMKTKGKKN